MTPRGAMRSCVAVFMACAAIAGPAGASTGWSIGHVFAGTSGGAYGVYDNAGAFQETITNGGSYGVGCAFNPSLDRLYTTDFNNRVVAFADASPHEVAQTITTGRPYPESIVFAADGRSFVGGPSNPTLEEYDASGTLIDSDPVGTDGTGGPDWIDLAADQHTVYYASEGRAIKRFDTATDTQLEDFATLPGSSNAFALRLLAPGDGTGGLLVADRSDVKRLDASGNVVQTYDTPDVDFWFALNLDPNGTSFWSGGLDSGRLYRFGIASGNVEVGPIDTGGVVSGLCVKGEPTAALCGENGLAVLEDTPAEGIASGVVHDVVEPALEGVSPDAAAAVHGVNCEVVVPVEDAIDDALGG